MWNILIVILRQDNRSSLKFWTDDRSQGYEVCTISFGIYELLTTIHITIKKDFSRDVDLNSMTMAVTFHYSIVEED